MLVWSSHLALFVQQVEGTRVQMQYTLCNKHRKNSTENGSYNSNPSLKKEKDRQGNCFKLLIKKALKNACEYSPKTKFKSSSVTQELHISALSTLFLVVIVTLSAFYMLTLDTVSILEKNSKEDF